jgi:hypothetical protein
LAAGDADGARGVTDERAPIDETATGTQTPSRPHQTIAVTAAAGIVRNWVPSNGNLIRTTPVVLDVQLRARRDGLFPRVFGHYIPRPPTSHVRRQPE